MNERKPNSDGGYYELSGSKREPVDRAFWRLSLILKEISQKSDNDANSNELRASDIENHQGEGQ